MKNFDRAELTVGDAKVVMYTAGQGEPLLFLHGAGTFHGFEFAEAWVKQYRVILPYHPGWGESPADPDMSEAQDYVMHYVQLLDALQLAQVNLVGFSLGGYLAAKFASQFPERVRKLVLVAPAGMRDDEHPAADVLGLPPEQLLPMLASNFDVVAKHLPKQPDLDFMGDRYREATATARLFWDRPWDPKLPRYLHRAGMPVLLLWGNEDKIIPAAQAGRWQALLPSAKLHTYDGAGHLLLDEQMEAVRAVAAFFA